MGSSHGWKFVKGHKPGTVCDVCGDPATDVRVFRQMCRVWNGGPYNVPGKLRYVARDHGMCISKTKDHKPKRSEDGGAWVEVTHAGRRTA